MGNSGERMAGCRQPPVWLWAASGVVGVRRELWPSALATYAIRFRMFARPPLEFLSIPGGRHFDSDGCLLLFSVRKQMSLSPPPGSRAGQNSQGTTLGVEL